MTDSRTRYDAWITAYVRDHDNFVRGLCAHATAEMVAAFPELTRVAGFVHCAWGRDQHWWCTDPDGNIVDPTASQFQGTISEYEVVDLSDPDLLQKVPTGVCAYCGLETYQFQTVCSDWCHTQYVAYCSGK